MSQTCEGWTSFQAATGNMGKDIFLGSRGVFEFYAADVTFFNVTFI
jgi:hypothetical protein